MGYYWMFATLIDFVTEANTMKFIEKSLFNILLYLNIINPASHILLVLLLV